MSRSLYSGTHRARTYLQGVAALLTATAIWASFAQAAPVAPIISPAGGYYRGSVPVTMNCFTPSTTIHYTTNGTVPTSGSPVYTAGTVLTLTSSETLNAVAVDASSNLSPVQTGVFTLSSTSTVLTPVISPDGGNTKTAVSVTITCGTSGAVIYYTTDGSVPTTSSTHYTGSFNVSGSAVLVRALATVSGYASSAIASSTFATTLSTQAAAPTISPNGGSFTGWTHVSLSSASANSVLRYTTDGTTPTAKSTIYNGAFPICTSTTLKVCAFSAGLADSSVSTASFTADTTTPTVYNVSTYGASPSSSDNSSALQSCLNAAENGANSSLPIRIQIIFPTGTYKIGTTLNLSNAYNIVINGQGSTLLSNNGGVTAFNIGGPSGNITIENLTFDEASPSNIPGYVTATTSGGSSFDCLLDPGFSYPSGAALNAVTQYDPIARTVSPGAVDISLNGTSTVPTALSSTKVHINLPYASVTTGMYVDLATSGQSTMNLNSIVGLSLINDQIYSGYQLGMFIGNCENVTLSHVDVLRKPGSAALTSNAVDAVHVYCSKGAFSVQDCDFENQGDDGINFAGDYETITSASGSTITVGSLPGFYVVGDLVEIRSGSTMLPLGTGVVTAKSGSTITLSSVPSGITPGSDCIHDRTWEPRPTVNRCNFIGNRARGVLVQTPNAMVENSCFESTSLSAIQVCTVMDPWNEATGVTYATVRNNSIENCNCMTPTPNGAIALFALNATGGNGAAGTHNNVAVEDNTIVNTDNPGIQTSSANNIDVINNTLQNVARIYNSGQPLTADSIVTEYASNVRYISNAQSESNYLECAYDMWMPSAPSGGVNVQPYVIGFSQTAAHMAQWTYSWNVQDPIPSNEVMFVHLTNSSGTIITGLDPGNEPTPSTWANGSHVVSSPDAFDLTSVPDGVYNICVGLYLPSSGTRLVLAGLNDGTNRIIVGTLTLSGSGTTITYTPTSLDIRPRVLSFQQTGPRQLNVAFSWDVHDTVPAGYAPFVHICDSTGTIITGLTVGTEAAPNTWTLGSVVVSSVTSNTLPSQTVMPDGPYTIRMGLYNSAGRLTLTGDPDTSQRIIAGGLSTLTGVSHPLYNDPSTTSAITMTGNTGF